MASTNKTSKLKLNKWLGTDKIQRVDFNNDNDIIEQEFLDRGVNVKWFGAKGDGVTDDSNAFISAIQFAEQQIRNNSISSNKLNSIKLIIPSGSFLITQFEALMRYSFITRSVGLQIQGSGRATTQILFKPSTQGYLMKNNDAWMFIHMSDIEFYSDNVNNNFMYSYSTGGSQNYTFERINWRGLWNYTFHLEGTDCNSEYTFNQCDWSGTTKKAMYIPSTNSSDQFLNYNFFACNFEVDEGDFIDFAKGGNINIWGGSYIHVGANAGTFFNFRTSTHATGVERFLCIGARIEHRNDNSKLIYSEWSNGNIAFINCDCASSFSLRNQNTVIATFVSNNVNMPIIKFDNCSLIGRHEYQYYVNTVQKQTRVVYENCDILQHQFVEDFILYTVPDSNGNEAGKPTIHFRNCRAKDTPRGNVWDCEYGYEKAYTGITSKKIISVKRADGKFPYSAATTADVYLPPNAIITKIILYAPSGAVGETGDATFSVKTTEATPVTLATITATNHSLGFDLKQDLFFICDSKEKRHIQLIADANVAQPNPSALCLIEFIG